jgi:non-canonical purine NTP pyrophosphatase (RdgB/HAM1 family)
VAAALTVVLPWCFLGIPSGHDFEFHMNSWMEVHDAWKQGIVYPRWAAEAHYAYGEARFLFYPPASWTLGAALGMVLPWTIVPGVYVWLALTLSGGSLFFLARRWLDFRDAMFAAALYTVNPYYLVIVYWRSAFAELLAGALLPLLLLWVLRAEEKGLRPAIWLSLLVAAFWLTNAPSAVMANYSLVLLVLVVAMVRRSWRVVVVGALAIAVGALLAAFYLVPAAFEQKWVNIAQVISPGLRPADNFLFTTVADPVHNAFNRLVSVVALGEVVTLAAAGLWIWRSRPRQHEIAWSLVAWGGVATLLMFPVTALLWDSLPQLRFVQLPWRWLLCLNVAFALLVTLALRRWWARIALCVVMLAVIAYGWHRIQSPWWDSAADVAEMQDNQLEGQGYEGTDEYVPAGADPYELNRDAPKIEFEGAGPAKIEIQEWEAERRSFTVETGEPGDVVLRLFNYPAWKVEVGGRTAAAQTRNVTGQMVIPVPTGTDHVRVVFTRTEDRTVGGVVSVLAAASVCLCWFWKGRTSGQASAGLTSPKGGGHGEATGAQQFTQSSPQTRISDVNRAQRVLIATSNAGKLRDFAGAASSYGIEIAPVPDFASLPPVVEDGLTFEANARKKAEEYSRQVPGEIVLADDSGLEIDALGGAPGVHSARYAAEEPHLAEANTGDEANNARVLRALAGVPREKRTGRFVCVLAAARGGEVLAIFQGAAEGIILDRPQGSNGFGYDPLFFFPQIDKTFAELSAAEKARYSHRGEAFRRFLEWWVEYGSECRA